MAVPFAEPRRDEASGFWGLTMGKVAFHDVPATSTEEMRARQLNVVVVANTHTVDNNDELQQQCDESGEAQVKLDKSK